MMLLGYHDKYTPRPCFLLECNQPFNKCSTDQYVESFGVLFKEVFLTNIHTSFYRG